MKRILFKRILVTYIIIAPVLLISLELYLSDAIKNNYIENLKQNLLAQARLIAEQVPLTSSHNLDDFCKRYKEKTGARITIIDDSGIVLGDSDEPSGTMENHANRPEIRDADLTNLGSSIRYSKTLRKNLIYLAIAFYHGSDKRFLRLSLPLHEVEAAVNTIRRRIIVVALAALLIALLIGFLHTRKIAKSVEEIAAFSKDIAAGNFRKRLFLKEKGELGELAKNIGNMAQELNERLKHSEGEKRKIEAILRNMSDGLILTDTKGRILLSNPAIKNFFGVESIIEGKTLMETLRNTELLKIINTVIETKERISREIGITHPKELHLMATATPFYSPGSEQEPSGVVITFHDITRLKKLEEIRKDFVANVSHEIKTPITAIKGFAETLLDGALDDRENAYKFLETIRNNSERLNSLVRDLLTLSRIELGDMPITKTPVNIDEVVDKVYETLKEKAQSKALYLKKQIPTELKEIYADRDRLIQIFLNLVDNGIKFTEQGGVTIKVQSSKFKVQNEEEKDYIEILIEDTGVGIPRKHLDRLGERFYRVDRARSRELGGTGLGLAIVKHLVMAHGWKMEIESTEGKGTTVHLLCPVT
jgi:two-component system phosphate regulon sensor histidine kinase PhoR